VKIFEQTLIDLLSSRPCLKIKLPDLAQNFFSVIVIAIEMLIRIKRTLIEKS
jgi:hypothetical protein